MKNIFFVFVVLAFKLVAQEPFDKINKQNFADKFNISVVGVTEAEKIRVDNLHTDQTYNLSQRLTTRFGLGLNYQYLGLRYVTSVGQYSPESIDLKGNTDFKHFRLQFFYKQFYILMNFYKLKGFFVENSQDFNSGFVEGETSYVQLPNLSSIYNGGSLHYFFNKKYSFRQNFAFKEKQLTPQGSFLAAISMYNTSIKEPSTNLFLLDESSFNANLSLGYAYNFVLGKYFYANLFFKPTVGVKFSDSGTFNTQGVMVSRSTRNLNLGYTGRASIGFAARYWFGGIEFFANRVSYENEGVNEIVESRNLLTFHVGYRFKTPKKVAKAYEQHFDYFKWPWYRKVFGLPPLEK